MKTVIITGASGFLAQSIFRSLKGHYKFIFISRKPSSFLILVTIFLFLIRIWNATMFVN